MPGLLKQVMGKRHPLGFPGWFSKRCLLRPAPEIEIALKAKFVRFDLSHDLEADLLRGFPQAVRHACGVGKNHSKEQRLLPLPVDREAYIMRTTSG